MECYQGEGLTAAETAAPASHARGEETTLLGESHAGTWLADESGGLMTGQVCLMLRDPS